MPDENNAINADDAQGAVTTVSDDELAAVSQKLIERNIESYTELAK